MGYREAIELYAPDGVDVVHDRYPLVSSTNDTIVAIRRDDQRYLEGEDRYVIEATRYLLPCAEENLEEQSIEKLAKLDDVLEANETIQKA